MYYRHFGLDGPPFRFLSSPAGLYLGESHREALAAMEWALLHEHCGFMVLIGETGTGKTTLLNAIVARRLANLHLAYVTNPKLTFEELMHVVLPQLGGSIVPGRLALIQALEAVVKSHPEGDRTAIVIDEAQALGDESLEDFRLLANATSSNNREIQFILMGQPELAERLSAPHLRQLRERIGAKAMLLPFSAQESIEYINFRLRAVKGAPGIFEGKALRCIVEASAGNPRRLNVLGHNALLLAYSKGAKTVSVAAAREVVADYESLFRPPILLQPDEDAQTQSPQRRFRSSPRKSYAAVAIVGVLAASSAGALKHASARDPIRSASSYRETAVSSEPAMSFESNAVISQPGNQMSRPAAELSPKAVAVVTASAAAPSSTKRTQIQIHAGDTFQDLAVRYLGSVDRTHELIMANPQIRNANVIVPGQIVYLPMVQSSAAQE
jgi:type II secretory pathway predicted ATPase ExeA